MLAVDPAPRSGALLVVPQAAASGPAGHAPAPYARKTCAVSAAVGRRLMGRALPDARWHRERLTINGARPTAAVQERILSTVR